jgi:hypothetical protein
VVRVEFVDDPAAPAGEPDSGRSGHAGGPGRWAVALVGAGTAVVAVSVLVHDPTHRAGSGAEHASAAASVVTDPHLRADPTALTVYLRAGDPRPATDVVRGETVVGQCRSVRIGAAPQRSAATSLLHALPRFRIVDTARIIDQSAGLCALQVRARDASGTVALIIVTSPPHEPPGWAHGLRTHRATAQDTRVQYAEFTTRDGWSVIVGTRGTAATQPKLTALGRLATDPAVRW